MKKLKNTDQLCVAAIRATCIDGINLANSGHPGASLSCAPILYVLYKEFLNATPLDSKWINRDRFVLSCGHASMLLYTVLHLAGYNITIDDLKSFRKFGSITPGHPEVNLTDGVDASSGPLGQGIAQAVGMCVAEEMLKAQYGKEIYDHYTYCLCGDGCLEEGISQEAITFAGLQKLNKLILLYDNNDVTLDGPLSQSSNEKVAERFLACGWDVIYVKDGNNISDIKKAIRKARKSIEKPTLIIFKTIIGYGSKNQGDHKVHGSPLGEEDGNFAKLSYGYTYPPFEIPQKVYDVFKETFQKRGEKLYSEHKKILETLKNKDIDLYSKIENCKENDISKYLAYQNPSKELFKEEASRKTSQAALNYYHSILTNFVGGSADVAGSVMTNFDNMETFSPEKRNGTNINFGIKEFAMASISNGMLLHGGLRTYCGCFLVFSDYMKNALRMSALMDLPQIYLFSHDSLAVGEDGPTHQPIEQLAALRSIPNFNVFRPCDAKETFASYKLALESTKTPSAIILTRQSLPLKNYSSDYDLVKRGAYIIDGEDVTKELDFVIVATGSEVSLAIDAKNILEEEGYNIRVVSMPCQELFDIQNDKYQESVLGNNYSKIITVEMGSTYGWHKYGKYAFGVDTFGASGSAKEIFENFGFTASNLANIIVKHI